MERTRTGLVIENDGPDMVGVESWGGATFASIATFFSLAKKPRGSRLQGIDFMELRPLA
jgi:hypothetical protein